MDKKTAGEYAQECRRVAEQYAKNDISKANWQRMAEAFDAEADEPQTRREMHSSSEQAESPERRREF